MTPDDLKDQGVRREMKITGFLGSLQPTCEVVLEPNGKPTVDKYVVITRLGHACALRMDEFATIHRNCLGNALHVKFDELLETSLDKELTVEHDDYLFDKKILRYVVECPDKKEYATYAKAVAYVQEDVFNVFRLMLCKEDNRIIKIVKNLHSYKTVMGKLGDERAMTDVVRYAAAMDEHEFQLRLSNAERREEVTTWVIGASAVAGGLLGSLVQNVQNFQEIDALEGSIDDIQTENLFDRFLRLIKWGQSKDDDLQSVTENAEGVQEVVVDFIKDTFSDSVEDTVIDVLTVGAIVINPAAGALLGVLLRGGVAAWRNEKSFHINKVFTLALAGRTIRDELVALQYLNSVAEHDPSHAERILNAMKKSGNTGDKDKDSAWLRDVISTFAENKKKGLLELVPISKASSRWQQVKHRLKGAKQRFTPT